MPPTKVKKEPGFDRHARGPVNRFRCALTVLTVVGALSLSGCSSGSQMDATTTAASKDTSAPAADQQPSLKPAAITKRAIVRNGSLAVRVSDAEKSEAEVQRYVASVGGYVAKSSSGDLTGPQPSVSMTLRVPVERFDLTMDKLEVMGTRLSKSISGEDVTAQIIDYDARLKTMLAQEASFQNMLRRSSQSAESLDLQTRLMKLREDIESMTAQRSQLADLAALSTIELTLQGEAPGAARTEDKGWAKEAWNQGTSTLSSLSQGLGTTAIFTLVLTPIWGPMAGVIWWAAKRSGGRKSKPTL